MSCDRIKAFKLSAASLVGEYELIELRGKTLTYICGGRLSVNEKQKTILRRNERDELLALVTACRVELWPARDNSRPPTLGRMPPVIELVTEDGDTLRWSDNTLFDPEAWARVDEFLSRAMSRYFSTMGRASFRRPWWL